jgi:hypothetical protein
VALRPTLSAVARVELGLAALLVLLVAIGFGIRESDDVWALVLMSLVLAAAPVAVLSLNKFSAGPATVLAAFLAASWPLIVWWILVYA